jgi:hypothetical protein
MKACSARSEKRGRGLPNSCASFGRKMMGEQQDVLTALAQRLLRAAILVSLLQKLPPAVKQRKSAG